MTTKIEKNDAPTNVEVDTFLGRINFQLPTGFIEFYKESNGADINGDEKYVMLWPLPDLFKNNEEYEVHIYAPEFFIFGSDGGGTAYASEKVTGNIFEIPFIGMSKEEAIFLAKTFHEFLQSL